MYDHDEIAYIDEGIDGLYFDTEVGDVVECAITLCRGGGSEAEIIPVSMIVVGLREYPGNPDSFIVELTPHQEESLNYQVYRSQMSFGEYFHICVGETTYVQNNTEFFRTPYTLPMRVDASLVGMGKAPRACVIAKYEAYMDPQIAALAETPGLITRNRAYKVINT